MIGASDLIPLVAPLVTFASVTFSVAVYLERNDEIGKLSYNAAASLAALTIVFGLAFVVFISISGNMTHIQSLKSLIASAALTGLLAAFFIGFGIYLSGSDGKMKKTYSIYIPRNNYSIGLKIVNRGSDEKLKITNFNTIDVGGGGNLTEEVVMLENTGDETLDLSNYTIQIAGEEDNYEFEETKLDPNAQLRLYIGSVTEAIELYSNKSERVGHSDWFE